MFERVQVTDIAQIYELCNDFAAAFNKSDLELLVSLWAEAGLQLPPDKPSRVGKDSIREGMQCLFEQFKDTHMTIQTEEVRILGDRAYAYGSFDVSLIPWNDKESKNISGKFLNILEKQFDGCWKISIDCHNYTRMPG
jgi:uncharacterized protein (TIGR02246 family)